MYDIIQINNMIYLLFNHQYSRQIDCIALEEVKYQNLHIVQFHKLDTALLVVVHAQSLNCNT